jgi:hypothetical protein
MGTDVCLVCLYVVMPCVGRGLCDELISRPKGPYQVPNKDSETRKWHRKTSIDVVTRLFKFNLISLWCSELSSGIYCHVKWLSADVSAVRTATIIRDEWTVGRQSFNTAVYPRRQFWTSYSPPWELEISHNFTLFVKVQCLDFHGYICQRGCVAYP